MDEVFGENNFLNNIAWFYKRWNIAANMEMLRPKRENINKAKYKYAVEHLFFNHLRDGSVLEGQEKFRCQLENMLEDN